MDSEPVSASRPFKEFEWSSKSSLKEDVQASDDEDPLSLNGPSITLLGLTIAIATVGIPIVAVITERPFGRESVSPTILELDGSKSSLPISLARTSKLGSGDSRWKQE